MNEQASNRRHFSRINFHAQVELQQEERSWEASLVDISLKGLLVILPNSSEFYQDKPVQGIIRLADKTVIKMVLRLAHTTNDQLGFYCESIDVESISHLRRLVELNLGDPAESDRELAELIGH